jgi:group II intron reverse transcriptase/maturase
MIPDRRWANGKMRPLTVAPPRDKIVQEVLRMILEAVFEPTFSDNSHGFRPSRSCHTALRQVKTQFGVASFYLEGDISKCFDSFDHHILMNIIERKIKDRRFTALLWKSLRAGYFEFHEVQSSIVGTPQGSVISPLLANIYLHALDVFMEKRMGEYTRGKVARVNPEYKHLEYQQYKALRNGETKEAIRLLKLKQLLPSRTHADPNFRRMYYVRYADDWIVAIRGPRTDVVQLLNEVKDFLKQDLGLDLSLEKTKITDPTVEPALFLGTEIATSPLPIPSLKVVYSADRRWGKQHAQHNLWSRVPSQLRMTAPLRRVYSELSSAGFMDLDKGKGVPRFL